MRSISASLPFLLLATIPKVARADAVIIFALRGTLHHGGTASGTLQVGSMVFVVAASPSEHAPTARGVRRLFMSDFVPKASSVKVGGLGRAAQKLQAAREKSANVKSGAKPGPGASAASFKAKDSFAGTKKTTFQRKAV